MENRCSKSEPKFFWLESRALRCDSTGNRNAVSIPVSFGCLAVVASGVGFVFGFVLGVKEENRRTSLVQGRDDNGEEIKKFSETRHQETRKKFSDMRHPTGR